MSTAPSQPPDLKTEDNTSNTQSGLSNNGAEPPEQTSPAPSQPQQGTPYSVFSNRTKRVIIISASLGSFLSPFTSNIYLPAITTIARDLKVPVSRINLTITIYMIFQGIAPIFVGTFSDAAGRRPAYLVGLVIFLVSNIALAVQNSFAALLTLRCFQAIGASGMVALASGVVADCVTSAERGSYIGYMSVGSVLGPSLSPILGGVISESWGWHNIFWILAIVGGAELILFAVFFPETCRGLVGDGSKTPPLYNRRLWDLISPKTREVPIDSQTAGDSSSNKTKGVKRRPRPSRVFAVLWDREIALHLAYCSVIYAGYYAILTSLSYELQSTYALSDDLVGLCFLPISVGGFIAVIFNSKLDPVDRNFRRHAKLHGFSLDRSTQYALTDFPLERARLEIMLPPLLLGGCVIIAYGWLLHLRVQIAGPLVLLAVIGFCASIMSKTQQVFLVDLRKDEPATITAAYNMVRSLLAAGFVAGVGQAINRIGAAWLYTLVGLSWVFCILPTVVVILRGPKWRKNRASRVTH